MAVRNNLTSEVTREASEILKLLFKNTRFMFLRYAVSIDS